jgi:hypothetical protein
MSCTSSATKKTKSVSFTSEDAAAQHLEFIIADLREQLKNKTFIVTQVIDSTLMNI